MILREARSVAIHKRLIEENLNQIRDKLLVMGGAAEKAILLSMRSL